MPLTYKSKRKVKFMKIQINTDNNIAGREELVEWAKGKVESTLGHLAEHITRVEVHLSDENGDKGGSHDKRCMMEARLKGHNPIGVSDEAESIGQAIDGAVEKIKKTIDHTLGRLSDR
jgi:ribosome-associated translation inhibitor RaiA